MDVVIPNAGIGYFNPLREAPLQKWHAMIDVNISGCCRRCTPPCLRFSRTKDMSSTSVLWPRDRSSQQRRVLRHETRGTRLVRIASDRIPQRLAVTTINPGAVNTPFIDRTTNEELRQLPTSI